MFKLTHRGNFNKTKKYLKKAFGKNFMEILEGYGKKGVDLLAANTPKDTGLTASSWNFKIEEDKKNGTISVTWYNTNVKDNGRYTVNVAILLQYGHATKNKGWVEGIDYINPALKPIFETMADAAWKEVCSV